MPLYDYQCDTCGREFELLRTVAKMENAPCPLCQGRGTRIFTQGHGGVQCDSGINVPWLPSATMTLQPEHERPVETRGEYRRYLRKNGIVEKG